MRLAQTVRYGYDEELIFAQQLGADAVVMRLEAIGDLHRALAAAAHRAAVSAVELAAAELVGLPSASAAWSDAVTGAVVGAQSAGVARLLCRAPADAGAHLPEDLGAVVAAANESGVEVCLDSASVTAAVGRLLPASDLRVELVVGVEPLGPAAGLAAVLRERTSHGGIGFVRLEGSGRPLGEGDLDVAACLAALRGGGYDGLVRAGAPPLLVEDDDWRPKGAAHDLGYLRAVLQVRGSR